MDDYQRGYVEGLREAIDMVDTLRRWPTPDERSAEARRVLSRLASELQGRRLGAEQGHVKPVPSDTEGAR